MHVEQPDALALVAILGRESETEGDQPPHRDDRGDPDDPGAPGPGSGTGGGGGKPGGGSQTPPTIYDEGTLLLVNLGDRLLRVKLVELLEATRTFARFHYTAI